MIFHQREFNTSMKLQRLLEIITHAEMKLQTRRGWFSTYKPLKHMLPAKGLVLSLMRFKPISMRF